MRWILIILLMCNGIFFLWQNYLVQNELPTESSLSSTALDEVDTLQLLSEVAHSLDEASLDRKVVAAAPAEGKSPADLAEPDRICWKIGPFMEEVSAKQVISRLAALDISLKLTRIEVEGKPDYWVHIPPSASRRLAIKLLKELQSKKIDSFLITEGELENGLSLGIFTQQARAEKARSLRVKQGYDAEIKLIPRTHTELWAIFDEGEHGKFSDFLWEKIKEGNRGLERRKNYCDRIASAGDFD